jgi:hypothetical protein
MPAFGAISGEDIGTFVKPEFAQFSLQVLKRHPQIQQRPHGHIAGNSGIAVKIDDFHFTGSLIMVTLFLRMIALKSTEKIINFLYHIEYTTFLALLTFIIQRGR